MERQQPLETVLTLADILKPGRVKLDLLAGDPEQGFEELARLLESDSGMVDRAGFHAALRRSGKPIGAQSLLSHIRTDHVWTMLLAAGRLPGGGSGWGLTPSGEMDGVQFLFLIAVPMTLAAEYLRLVGALARSLRDPATVAALRETGSAQEFVRILCAEAADGA